MPSVPRSDTPSRHRHIKDLYPSFWAKTKELITAIEKIDSDSDRIVEVDEWVSRGTLDAMSLACFSSDFRSLAQPNSDLVRKYRQAFTPGESGARVRVLANILPLKLVFKLPLKWNKETAICSQTILALLTDVIEKRKAEPVVERQKHQDILNTLLETPTPRFLETRYVANQCINLLAAGHEASSLALTWTLYELSKDQARQQRLRDEVRNALPSPFAADSTVDPAIVDQLPYLTAVVKESLRFWSPVPKQTRISYEPARISDTVIPAKTPLVVSFYAMNRSTRNWGADADLFRPERWLEDDEAKVKAMGGAKDRYGFSTFSHGARACPGHKFAHSELLVFLAGLVGSFEWLPVQNDDAIPDHDSSVMLKARGGLRLRARRLEGW